MADLTPKDIQSDIKPFQEFSDEHIKQDMGTAESMAKADQITDQNAHRQAVIAYTRHLLVADQFQANGGVTNASVMGNSQAIANPNTYPNGDQYLQTYNKLAENYGNPVGQGRVISMNGLGGNDLF